MISVRQRRSLAWRSAVLTLLFLGTGLVMGTQIPQARASASSKNKEGNKLYEEKKYPEALKRYTEAQLAAPDSPQLHYNLGNVFFRQGEVEKAREEYRRALAAADASLDPRAVYNLGNTFFSQQQYQEAVDAYQRALKLAPKDMDAKRNLELALLAMKQQQQQQQQQQKPDDKNKDDSQENSPSKPSPDDKNPDKPQSPKQGDSNDPKKKPGQQQRPKGGLTREEAERILSALQEDEKENLKKRLEAQKEEQRDVEEDW
ncbi:MAG TPA: tetratricopeptide repeat protein [Candidatus Polarisedimenticolia bacterium]|nr:tetratricopeptide repeat protein [Candidatus Polarisedimenticolia bacterium]